jgi:UDP-glucose 4-epimerase
MITDRGVLVTGGAGFIGSNLVDRLCKENEVTVIDNLSAGSERNLSGLEDRINFVKGDIRDKKAIQEALRGVDIVFHCAAQVSVERSVENPLETNQINVEGTLRLLWTCKEVGVENLIFPSSAAVYGSNPEIPKREEMRLEADSPYAASKIMGERYCRLFHRLYRIPTVILRCFNVFGPRQDESSQYASVIPKFISAIINGEKPQVFGDGNQTRDFVFVDDVVDAFLLAASKDRAKGETINVASGKPMSILNLLEKLHEILGENAEPEFLPERPGDVRHSQADIAKAERVLGFVPRVEPRAGLQMTIDFFKNTL